MSPVDEPNALPDAGEAPARESMSLKRGREGSVDLLANETPTTTPIAAKKNRIELESTAEHTDEETATTPVNAEGEGEHDASTTCTPSRETKTVGEVRKKVEEMTWKEGKKEGDEANADKDKGDEESEAAEAAETDKADNTASQTDKLDATSDTDSQGLKRKAHDQGENGTASDEKKRKSASPTPAESSTPSAPASADPPKKPQATFGAFSAKASPFATSSASPFGAASSSSPFGGASQTGTKPSSSGFASSGFGSYSNAFSKFATKKPEEKTASSSFGEILKERGEEVEETKLQLDKQDAFTGEEDEVTVYQTRVKLFALDGSGAWKERGVGTLKLNKKRDDGSGARLVMRNDGVLRVILNAFLYVGMNCLEDGKHIRTSVFEGKDLLHVTIRTGSPKAAAELANAINHHIPIESRRPSPAKADKEPEGDKSAAPAAGEKTEEETESA